MKVTNEEFVQGVWNEGLGYGLSNYYSEATIWQLTDERLRELALKAKKALEEFEEYVNDKYEDALDEV